MEYVRKEAVLETKEKKVILRASPPVPDLTGLKEKILPSAWDLSVYEKNPVVLYMHNKDIPPIGRGKATVDKEAGLLVEIEFDNEDELAQKIEKKVRRGFLNAGSVGFMRLDSKRENDMLITTKALLLEVSIVSIPANPEALIINRSFENSFVYKDEIIIPSWDDIFDLLDIKGAVAPHRTPKAPEDLEWDKTRAINNIRKWASTDGSGDKDKIQWNRYKLAFAWYNSAVLDNFGSYKLPHHDIYQGRFVVVWRGVAAAYAAVMGARGGVNIPAKDKPGVLAHLKAHYKQFDKPWPAEERTLYEYESEYTQDELEKLARAIYELRDILAKL